MTMPNLESTVVLAVVVAAMGLFISGKLRVDLIALCVLTALVVLRLIEPGQALYGFASPATATVAAMFVLSAGLVRTGLVQWLARRLDRLAGKSETRLVLVLCAAIAVLSAFIVNTATVAIFIPVAAVLARARRIAPSRVLMPLSFASQFGGVCTLIGTSTNILVNSIAVDAGLAGFGLFEFARLGILMSVFGIVYLVIATRWLLPRREGEIEQVDKYRLADYLAELLVEKTSSLIGKTWVESEAGTDRELTLIKLIRGGDATWRPLRTKLEAEDILVLHGDVEKLMALADQYGLTMKTDVTMRDQEISSDELKLIETVIPPRSSLVGRTLRDAGFFRRYGGVVLALQRRGRVLRERLGDIQLDGGDTLLVQGGREDVSRLMRSPDLIVTNELTELYLRKDRAVYALLLLLAVVVLAVTNAVPIFVAALIGAVGMVLSGCLRMEEAYRAIDWRVIFLLGGILPLGLALEETGAAAWLANATLGPFVRFGPVAVLAVIYIVTAILTETMSNNAAAILLAPIALSAATSINVDPRPFLVAITFAASTSFATPVGYQTNTMIYAPGGYRFSDYTRVGGPLNVVFWGLAVLLIPLLWPL